MPRRRRTEPVPHAPTAAPRVRHPSACARRALGDCGAVAARTAAGQWPDSRHRLPRESGHEHPRQSGLPEPHRPRPAGPRPGPERDRDRAGPERQARIVASQNDYRRGDGNCYTGFSGDGGATWTDSTPPMGFTRGDAFGGFARQYWQAGGDTSVAWDTKGNAYLSCQMFMRGTAVSNNPDQSSAFYVFRSTGTGGASWNFPGAAGRRAQRRRRGGRRAARQAVHDRRQPPGQPVPGPHLRDLDAVRRGRHEPTSTRRSRATTASTSQGRSS